MADISNFYPGNDTHPVDEAAAAQSLDHRAFNPDKPEGHYQVVPWITGDSPTGALPGFSFTNTSLSLPDGTTFTPSGAGITPDAAATQFVRYDEAQTIQAANQLIARTNIGAANVANEHPALSVTETQNFIAFDATTQALTFSDVDLTADVTGQLPIANINQSELNTRIDQRAAAIGTVHPYANNAAFQANTDTWHVGDILIIQDTNTTYLYIGTNDATSQDIADFQQITVSGGGINQATADLRYLQIGENLSEVNAVSARTNLGLGDSSTRNVGTAMGTVAAGDHEHDNRYPRFDADMMLTGPQRTQFFNNVGAFSGLVFGGAQMQDFNAQVQNIYILDNINEDRTATLPSGIVGAEIRIMNLSTFQAGNPGLRRDSSTWTIAPATGERIATLPANETLVLDNAFASFSLTYTDATNGWIITGVE